MLSLPTTVRIYAAADPVDLRKGFTGLSCLVREVIDGDPLSGHMFVFVNRRGDRIKVLFWTRNGYCVLYKRLERGRFVWTDTWVYRNGLWQIVAAQDANVKDPQ